MTGKGGKAENLDRSHTVQTSCKALAIAVQYNDTHIAIAADVIEDLMHLSPHSAISALLQIACHLRYTECIHWRAVQCDS